MLLWEIHCFTCNYIIHIIPVEWNILILVPHEIKRSSSIRQCKYFHIEIFSISSYHPIGRVELVSFVSFTPIGLKWIILNSPYLRRTTAVWLFGSIETGVQRRELLLLQPAWLHPFRFSGPHRQPSPLYDSLPGILSLGGVVHLVQRRFIQFSYFALPTPNQVHSEWTSVAIELRVLNLLMNSSLISIDRVRCPLHTRSSLTGVFFSIDWRYESLLSFGRNG